jgi:hypothetical protein
MKTYTLHHHDHSITFHAFEDGTVEILACELLIDDFQFDGILSDATVHTAIAENEKHWVAIEPNYPYNPSASIMEVLRNEYVYSPEKVAAAKAIYSQLI